MIEVFPEIRCTIISKIVLGKSQTVRFPPGNFGENIDSEIFPKCLVFCFGKNIVDKIFPDISVIVENKVITEKTQTMGFLRIKWGKHR